MAVSLFTTDEQRLLFYGKLNYTISHKLIHMSFVEFQHEWLSHYFRAFVARLGLSGAPSVMRRFVGVKTLAISKEKHGVFEITQFGHVFSGDHLIAF